MSDISTDIRIIQQASRGEEVRDAIVDALMNIDNRTAVTVDDALSESSENPVQNRAVNAALGGKQDALVFDQAPASGSGNVLTSGAVYEALMEKQGGMRIESVVLSALWEGSGPYTQAVTIPDTTEHSKVDIQPDAAVLSRLISDGVTALWIQNDAGILTAYALGAAPASALTVQCSVTEVMT